MIQQPGAAPLNTKSIGIGGLALVLVGAFAPSIAQHAFHASPDIVVAIQSVSDYFKGLGTAGAYLGMPITVKS